MIWYDWLNYLNPLPEKEIEEPSQTRGNMIWGVWWWVEGWKGNMEEGFLGRLSRRRMAGPIYIIILLLSPGDAKIDDADVKQVVVELNQWKWLWRLWQNSRVSIFWQPAVIIVLSAYPRIDEAKSLLAFIVLLILSLSLKLSVWISELFVNTAPWEKTRMIKEEIGRIANTLITTLKFWCVWRQKPLKKRQEW